MEETTEVGLGIWSPGGVEDMETRGGLRDGWYP